MKNLYLTGLLISIFCSVSFSQAPLSKQWDSRFGGDSQDLLNSFSQTAGGYFLGGTILSDSSGDVTEHAFGGGDYWVVKTDGSGQKTWDKRFGGNETDNMLVLLVQLMVVV